MQSPEGDKADSEVDDGHTSGRASSRWKACDTVNFVNFAPASSPVATVNIRNIRPSHAAVIFGRPIGNDGTIHRFAPVRTVSKPAVYHWPSTSGGMVLQARLAASRAVNRRTSPRRTLRLESTLVLEGESVTIHDISNTGLLLETSASLAEGQRLDVDLPEIGLAKATVVWASARFFGCRFTSPVSKAAVSAALLRSPVARADQASGERAWETLGAQLADPRPAADPGELSFAVKMRVILGASLALWAIILWALGLF